MALLAVAAMGLSACNEQNLTPEQVGKGELVTVHFGANSSIEPATKATLTTGDEETFKSAWEDGDQLHVEYSNDGESFTATTNPATWNGSSFETTIPPSEATDWYYTALYPAPTNNEVDFGSARTQKGNAYNSKYDIMKGYNVAGNAKPGEDENGKPIVFEMNRLTGIVYFHLTSNLDEEVVSATFTATNGNIAAGYVLFDYSLLQPDNYSDNITITFEDGTAPKASDFKLWFNVLPTSYKSMSLHVETTGHTLDITRNAKSEDGEEFVAGKLYKTVATVPNAKWVAKSTPSTSYKIEFNNVSKTVTAVTASTKSSTFVVAGKECLLDAPYSGCTKAYYGGDETDGLPLRIGSSKDAGSITISLSELGQINATNITLSAKQYFAGKTFKVGVNNEAKQQPGDDYTDLSFDLDGNKLTTIKLDSDGYIYVKSITVTAGEVVTKYSVSVSEVEGGTISVSSVRAAEGAEVTLTATPDAGYEFNNDWVVTAADGSDIAVVDGKFTMPAQDVTVYGTFSKVVYTITKAATENGSFVVKKGETEVTEANYKDVITLEATPAEGYICDSWSVKDADGESINVNSNKFTMPASNVTISVTFVEKPVDVKYDHAGTEADPYNISDVFKLLSTLGTATSSEIYAKGTITSIKEVSTEYKNATYYIGDDSTTETIQVFRGKYLNGADFTSTDQIQVGDEVVIKGKVKVFVKDNIETKEFDTASSIISLRRIEPCATPVIDIDKTTGAATITCETTGATIHYTVGESPADPTENDAVYSSAVTLTDGQTIKAFATATDHKPSAVASKKYTAVGGASTIKTYRHVFNTKPSTGNKVNLSNVNWDISATNLNGYNPSNYAGVQFGTSKNSGEIKLTSSSVWSYEVDGVVVTKIKEIRVWLNKGGGTVTPSVSIGGKTATSDGNIVAQNKDAKEDWTKTTKVTFTPASDGNTGVVVIDISSTKAGYICAIEIDAEN